MQKSVMKYITRIGQKTGMLKNSKKVQKKAIPVALVAEYQNLNSGNRRTKGLKLRSYPYWHSTQCLSIYRDPQPELIRLTGWQAWAVKLVFLGFQLC